MSSSFDSKWLILPSAILNSLSIAALFIGGIEFMCAQTPYSMRGLLFGAMYASVVILYLIGYAITQPFTGGHITNWGTGILSCGFWYLLLSLILQAVSSLVLLCLGRWYKKRKREDVLPNEHIFAERYYSR